MADLQASETVIAGGGRAPKHLWDYWRIAWEGRWKLLAILGATMAVALVGTLLAPKKYRAVALLEVSLGDTVIIGGNVERLRRGSFYERDQSFNTEFEKIESRRLVSRAIEDHDLLEVVPLLSRSSDPVRILQYQLRANRVPQTNAVKISVSWTDPEVAAVLANAIAETYQESDLRERTEAINLRVRKLSELAEQKGQERRKSLEYDLAILQDSEDLEKIFSLGSVQEDESLRETRSEVSSLEREQVALSAQYGPGHQEMKRVARELEQARAQLRDALAAHARVIEDELASMGGVRSGEAAFQTTTEKEVSEEIWNKLLESTSEHAIIAQTLEPKAKIIDPAIAPIRAYSPRLALNLLLALIVGLGFGGGLLFFQEYLDVSVKTLEDVEQDLGLTLLAVVPTYEGEPDGVAREAFQTLRTSVVFASQGRKDHVVLLTAAAPREGKTSTVAHLARSLAATGESVIVVDCDLRRPALARELGVDARLGLSSYLAAAGDQHWRTFVQRSTEGVDVLATGPVPPNPLQVLGLERFRELIGELKEAYDWVLLDSPPASSVSDATVLADVADMAIVLIRHDETDREVIRRAVQRLLGVGARVVGAVLNGVDISKAYNRDYYYGRFYYGHYYGEDGGADGARRARPTTGGRRPVAVPAPDAQASEKREELPAKPVSASFA